MGDEWERAKPTGCPFLRYLDAYPIGNWVSRGEPPCRQKICGKDSCYQYGRSYRDRERLLVLPVGTLMFKLSPELGDGQSSSIVKNIDHAIEAVRAWMEDRKHGDDIGEECQIECVEMTEAEIAALPEL